MNFWFPRLKMIVLKYILNMLGRSYTQELTGRGTPALLVNINDIQGPIYTRSKHLSTPGLLHILRQQRTFLVLIHDPLGQLLPVCKLTTRSMYATAFKAFKLFGMSSAFNLPAGLLKTLQAEIRSMYKLVHCSFELSSVWIIWMYRRIFNVDMRWHGCDVVSMVMIHSLPEPNVPGCTVSKYPPKDWQTI